MACVLLQTSQQCRQAVTAADCDNPEFLRRFLTFHRTK
jgi:hypothetical protein